jgi:hypothetical protein
MPQLFVHIELRHDPHPRIFEKLRNYMYGLAWFPTITGHDGLTVTLPSGSYQTTSHEDHPDVRVLANHLRAAIEQDVWKPAVVLVINGSSGWCGVSD